MGLDISHETWHGAYSAFHAWRQEIARVAGLPPLDLMEGFYDENSSNPFTMIDIRYPDKNGSDVWQITKIRKSFPIKWDCLKPNPLYELLTHSDSEGYINWSKCEKIADELEKLLPLFNDENIGGHIGNWKDKTKTFIKGLRLAFKKKERLQFR
ncbi:MAG: hypothetical protein JST58_04020 [Bacteroidetes bacterium]|nr:hypothetical protein [Bacteroidota bacterium]